MSAPRGPSRAPPPRVPGYADATALRTEVARARRPHELSEARQVLRAVGIEHAVVRDQGAHLLVVPAADGLRARAELAAYRDENAGWSAPPQAQSSRGGGWIGALVYAALLTAVHLAAGARPAGRDWSELGLLDGAAVLRGEWYRVVTALTLHADAPHLASNAAFGGLFGWALAQMLGSGVGWASVLAAGAAGNALNVWLRAVPHRALGASTAVFASVGLAMVLAWSWRRRQRMGRMGRLAPVVAGIGLVGWLGTSGEHVDIPAHLFGFLAGLVLGLPLASVADRGPPGTAVQVVAGALALVALGACWVAALA